MQHSAMEPWFRVLLVSGREEEPPAIGRLVRQAGLQPESLERIGSMTEAVGLVADQTVGAVLLDLSTADASGLAGLVRLQSIAPGIPILAFPGFDDTAALEQAHAVTCLQRAARKREQDRRLVHVATRDRLTGLANRWLLEDRLKCAIGRARRSAQAGALYFFDLDNFKAVNDQLGHEAGDHLLQAFGQRMLRSMRESDTVARLGGDEFVVVMDKVVNRGNGERIRTRLQRLLGLPYELPGRQTQVTVSVGLALFPDEGSDLETLLRVADQAMYRDKRSRADQAAR
ncbi:MAG TPA: diguanylate cyclase [Geminicoccus sp.]|jgi:diguanylate cyclase (GGDEF)-like protein|uniref:diguanylate cyclase domain-containing protein n=1 Tax=Geminicoccus sp. TaxID=2024832 RepID=UPI002E31CAB5|nr:diguanylate cyclase [Geminicoccus sp.]HEX2527630.1 diguanylate cyclase [Geminicoccus sp.]